MRSEAQKRADIKHDAKRSKECTRLSGYLNKEEEKLLQFAIKEFGTRKGACMGALRFWKKHRNK